MKEPTFEQQQETARRVIEELLNADDILKGICEFLPYDPIPDANPIRIYLPKYYDEVGNQSKYGCLLLRKESVYWFPCTETGKQQRIESLKRVYNL